MRPTAPDKSKPSKSCTSFIFKAQFLPLGLARKYPRLYSGHLRVLLSLSSSRKIPVPLHSSFQMSWDGSSQGRKKNINPGVLWGETTLKTKDSTPEGQESGIFPPARDPKPQRRCQLVPVWDGEGQEGGMPEHLQDEGFRVGQRAPVRQPRPPLPPDGAVWGGEAGEGQPQG